VAQHRIVALVLALMAARVACAASFHVTASFADPDHAGSDRFGASVATLAGGVLVVGSPADRSGASGGSAYAVAAGAGSSTRLFSDTFAGARFGSAIAAVGNLVVVGAPGDGPTSPASGRAYLFDPDTTKPGFGQPLQVFADPALAAGDQFGAAIATAGSMLIVGTPGYDGGAVDAGMVYLVDSGSGAVRSLAPPDPRAGDQFGAAVAVAAGRIVVGAPFRSETASNAGAAYIFDATTGMLLKSLAKPVPAEGDLFGAAVAAGSDIVVVGAPFDDGGGADAGAAYVFDAGTGALLRTLFTPPLDAGGAFGAALAVAPTGGLLLIGAPAALNGTGTSYVFDGGGASFRERIPNPIPTAGSQFGLALAVLGDGFSISAPGTGNASSVPGQGYLFSSCGGPCSPGCGNGVVEQGEECDDGNATDGDGCDHNCTLTRCGNGVRSGSEMCDGADDQCCPGNCQQDCACPTCVPLCPPCAPAGNPTCGPAAMVASAAPQTTALCCPLGYHGLCNDGNACTGFPGFCDPVTGDCDVCDGNGNCIGDQISCDDQIDCTVDSCDPATGCIHTPDDARCDDGNPCTRDSCDPLLGCRHLATGCACAADADCPEENPCTGVQHCVGCGAQECLLRSWPCCATGPTCKATAVSCPPRECMSNAGCDPVAGCLYVPASDGTSCGDACQTCKVGICTPRPVSSCDDGDPCTADSCNTVTGCVHTRICDCVTNVDCDDKNPCTRDACTGGTCSNEKLSGTSCSDNDPCNGVETCADGVCKRAALRPCFVSVKCALANLLQLDVCAGAQLPHALSVTVHKATGLVDRADARAAVGDRKAARQLIVRAVSYVRSASQAVESHERRAFPHACAVAVRTELQRVAKQAKALRTPQQLADCAPG
jgi:cysteine-rich repeat protein